MRAISVLSLVLLAGCAAAMEADQPILRPRHQILHINGTFEPVVFAVKPGKMRVAQSREACQTNDPMPTGSFEQTPPQMLQVRPLHVAPMPNYCPVTAPSGTRTVVTRAPRPQKTAPRPAPTEPQP